MNKNLIRNIAIIAHVDHGKTTLVDGLLKQSHTFRDNQAEMQQELIMDSGDQEHERGITITAKQTAVFYQDYKINIIDTPGHADFSGEVERTLNMADGVLLIVDAAEGPMPQTKFVLKKALDLHLTPIVIINKIDKPAARIPEVESEVADLFLELATDDAQLEYPVYYAIARNGAAWATVPERLDAPADLTPVFDAVISHIPEPQIDDREGAGLQLLVAALAADNYLGKYAIGKVVRSRAKQGEAVTLIKPDGTQSRAKIEKLFTYKGLTKEAVTEAVAGDIVAIAGIAEASIGDTIATGDAPEALPSIELEPPTLSIYVGPNTSPFKGREGEFTTSRQIGNRLQQELETNIALRLEPDGLGYKVSGRGELHLSVLIEAMRREGYELEVGRPEVVYKEIDGVLSEPIEDLTIETAPEHLGAISQELGIRRAELLGQENTTTGTIRQHYEIATAALIGLRSELLTATKGTVIMNSLPKGYRPSAGKYRQERNGALVAYETAPATAYALSAAEDRGLLFVGPGTEVYQGMIVGLYNKRGDLDINVAKEKQLTNMRSKASDGAIQLTPHTQMSLEQCLDFLQADELLEVTPAHLRLRKRHLDPIIRKRAARAN
jgi:GTP-binding protein